MQNPANYQALMMAAFSGTGASVPKLTKERTKELYIEQEEKKMDSLKAMLATGRGGPMGGMGGGGDPMEQMF